MIFSTYSSLIGETSGPARFKSRLEQLVHWCGSDFDGVIILDECHKAKNLMPAGSSKPTKTGINVLKLQNLLPKARVVYCSATGENQYWGNEWVLCSILIPLKWHKDNVIQNNN